MAVPYW